jgi:biopolymer transport protein ExbD
MNFGEKTKKRVTINITSLVDILIVLLLFFMLTTEFIKMEIIKLNISGDIKANNNQAVKKSIVKIILTGANKFILNGSEYNLLQLKDKIKPLIDGTDEKDIILVCKKNSDVQDVVSAIDYIKAVGGKNISIAEDK